MELACKLKLPRRPIEELERFQGNLKTLHRDQYDKLKNSLEKHGFFAPMYVWENRILDGHQRLNVLTNENWTVAGGVPVVEVTAKNATEAAEKALLISSTYGKIEGQGLYEFTAEHNIELPTFELVDLPDLDLERHIDEFHLELPPAPVFEDNDNQTTGISGEGNAVDAAGRGLVQQVVLMYGDSEYLEIVELMTQHLERLGVNSFSEVVLSMLRGYEENNS